MKSRKTYTVGNRRKRQSKTDYRKRLKLLESGEKRLVVRKSLHRITASIVEYDSKGDKAIVASSSAELKKYDWKYGQTNTPAAYLVGFIVAKKAKDNGIKGAILDMGLNKPVAGCKIYSVLKGAIDGGLNIPHSENILPSEDRFSGKHIENYANELKKDENQYKKKFSKYIKNEADPTKMSEAFNNIKNKITGA